MLEAYHLSASWCWNLCAGNFSLVLSPTVLTSLALMITCSIVTCWYICPETSGFSNLRCIGISRVTCKIIFKRTNFDLVNLGKCQPSNKFPGTALYGLLNTVWVTSHEALDDTYWKPHSLFNFGVALQSPDLGSAHIGFCFLLADSVCTSLLTLLT